jgi:NAD(P)-dependent dehydrogenase (short-subunit alcohol dehydrogenase family)
MTADQRTHRIWLITGATSGFGRALTEAAVSVGHTVIGAARTPDRLDDLVSAYPDQVLPVQLDVTDTRRDLQVVADVVARYGRIDVLVNNAGRTQVGALEETTEQELRALFDLHFFGPAALTRAVLPHMRRQGSGAVVQMSSVGGQVTAPGFSAYCATKFALEGMTEALSQEVDFGVRFLIVEPGAFRTGLFNPVRPTSRCRWQSTPPPSARPVTTWPAATARNRVTPRRRPARSWPHSKHPRHH